MGWLPLVGSSKITGLFCKRALQKRRYSAKETYNFKEPTNRSHPIIQTEENQSHIHDLLVMIMISAKIDKIDTKIDQIETDCQDPGYFLQWPYIETAHSINATFAPELIASGIL